MTDTKKHLYLLHKEWFKASVTNKRYQASTPNKNSATNNFFIRKNWTNIDTVNSLKIIDLSAFFRISLNWQAGLTNDDKWLTNQVDGEWCLSGRSVSYPTYIRISDGIMFNNVLARDVWCGWKDNSYAIICMFLNCWFNFLEGSGCFDCGCRHCWEDIFINWCS